MMTSLTDEQKINVLRLEVQRLRDQADALEKLANEIMARVGSSEALWEREQYIGCY